jgi:hypothetical protein
MSNLADQWSHEARRLSYQANRPLHRASEMNFGLIALVALGVVAFIVSLTFPGADWTAVDFLIAP